jgi:membrane associated rhomboid family serine protease
MGETVCDVFGVRFYRGGANWPSNPFRFQGAGEVAIEADFVTVRGSSQRSFRFPKRAEHRLRKADIVNVRVEGPDVLFDVVRVEGSDALGFSAADRDAARAIAAQLPTRWTPAFKTAYTEREVFLDRIDYWSPSTPVIWILVAANVGIYLAMWLQRLRPGIPPLASLLGWGSPLDTMLRAQQLLAWGSNAGSRTLHGEPWRLVTSMFLHGNLLHLAFNMFALWQVGQLVERIFGSKRFLALYLLAGIAGSVASVLWGTIGAIFWHASANSVGASGAVFGIIGGLLAFLRHENSGVPQTIVADLRGSVLPFLLFNLMAGFLYPHTDNAAHIGGLVGGWLAGHFLARSLHVPAQ